MVFSAVICNTIQYHSVPLDHSMIKSRFSGTRNGIGTFLSIINQTLVVFSMIFENITQSQYVPLDHSVLKHFFAIRSMVYKNTFSTIGPFNDIIRLQWYCQWYFRIPLNTIGLLNDKTCFNGIFNGIGTNFSTINQTSVVFSMIFQNTVQYHWTTQ